MPILSGYLFYFFLAVIITYVVFIFRWLLSWLLYPVSVLQTNQKADIKITVIVAVRNEEHEILNCLHALKGQVYTNLEIIISDDFSEDDTRQIVATFINNAASGKTWRLLEAALGDATGKKAALERAIKVASGNLIMTTDADCTMGNYWIRSFADCFQKTNAAMITGFVRMKPGETWLSKFQALEFMSLSGTGSASVISGKPLMCNGANLAFTKSAFNEAGGYSYGDTVPSGDDTFLMLQIARSGRGKVVFNKSFESIITSKPVATWNELISQRKRWASKVQFYTESYIKKTGILIAAVNFSLLFSVVLGLTDYMCWSEVMLIWTIKSAADFLFLIPVSRFARQHQFLLLFLPAVIIYPVYALAGIFSAPGKVSYSWKNRDYTVSK